MQLFTRKLGDGPPLIILHGLYGSSDNWLSIAKVLAEKYTVYLVDQRNHGQSPHDPVHDYPSMKDDLVGFMNTNQIEKAVIIGHSMGGKTAVFLAESHPEKIESLIVIDIAPTGYTNEEHSGASHQAIVSAMAGVDFSKVESREDVDEQLAETIKSARIRSFLLKNILRNKDGSFSWRLNVEALKNNLEKVMMGLDPARYSGGEEIAGFPVLFIRGEKSGYITDDDILIINQIFPMARVTTIPNAGHWLHVEQASLLLKTIRYFL